MSDPDARPRLSAAEWLVALVAALGFLFDQYELLLLPLVVQPALSELIGAVPGSATFNLWVGLLFWLPAVCGGVFGLFGGYITDRYGRRRVLFWSVLLYACASCASAFSTSALFFLACRCLILIGVCVEFVAGIAWLAESIADPRRREAIVGLTQAVSSLGGVLVTGIYLFLVTRAEALPPIYGDHSAWRYLCLSGLLPAIPLILVRPFLPESPMWRAGTRAGGQVRVSTLFSPRLRRTTVLATLATAATYALAYGAMQHLPRIVTVLPLIAELDGAGRQLAAGQIQMVQEIGGLTGRFLLAGLVVIVLTRRRLLQSLQWAALLAFPLTFGVLTSTGVVVLSAGVAVTAALTAAQFSFWGNYLPRVFPTHVRGTGASFAANIGGRIVGTSAALATTMLATAIGGTHGLAWAAALVAVAACIVGLLASLRLSEPASARLPDW